MSELEKQNLLGIGSSVSDGVTSDGKGGPLLHTPQHRMQMFVGNVYEDTFHTLANAFHALSHEIYNMPNLAVSLIGTVFSNLEVSSVNVLVHELL